MGQLVKIDGQSGLYVVVRVDLIGRVADLMQRGGIHQITERIPFDRITPVDGDTSKAVNRFLNSVPMQCQTLEGSLPK